MSKDYNEIINRLDIIANQAKPTIQGEALGASWRFYKTSGSQGDGQCVCGLRPAVAEFNRSLMFTWPVCYPLVVHYGVEGADWRLCEAYLFG